MVIYSFPPIATPQSHTLILGSMPGALSLQMQQYYAHPRNAFWPIMGDLLDFDPKSPYPLRITALQNAHIALWDVLQTCSREGSLDTAIDKNSLVANDFAHFLAKHRHIRRIFFNGATAETVFRRRVLPTLKDHGELKLLRLPSTSPAHAALSVSMKIHSWRIIIRP